jgi:hypothetical protein
MKFNSKSHRKYAVAIGALLITTSSFAQFGLPTVVFDPTSYGELVTQATTAFTQLKSFEANITHFSFKNLWQTTEQQMKQANVGNLFGETTGMSVALNTNSPTTASTGWTSATVPLHSTTTNYMATQNPGSAQMAQLAMIEASDSTSPDCINAVGAYRAERTNDAAAVANLQQQQLDTSTATNSEVEQLNLLNAAESQKMVEMQAQGALHSCLASQMAVANMQQRNAAADDLNTAAYVKQQQATTAAFDGGGSSTLTTYLP